jgi:transcriptional regulator with XRE-family HTH domain
MNTDLTLAEVLEEYAVAASSGSSNSQEKLRLMMEKYPQFSEELVDFAAARAQIKYSPDPEIPAGEEKRYQEIGLKNLNFFLKETKASPALESLTDAAKERGLSKSKLASALGLSLSLVMYLEKKRLRFASIPKQIIARLAKALEVSEAAVSNYLNQSADLATNASFKSQTRPEEVEQKDFAEAVKQDQALSQAQKNELLKLKENE